MEPNICKYCETAILGEFPIKKFLISYFTYCPNCNEQQQILWGYDPVLSPKEEFPGARDDDREDASSCSEA